MTTYQQLRLMGNECRGLKNMDCFVKDIRNYERDLGDEQ